MEHWTKVLEDWFTPASMIQLRAFAHVQEKGVWPPGYYDTLPSKVQDAIGQSNGLWSMSLYRILGDTYMREKGAFK